MKRRTKMASAQRRCRLRLLHREQVDHLAPAPHRLVLRQHAGVGALLGIDRAFHRQQGGTNGPTDKSALMTPVGGKADSICSNSNLSL